MRPKLIDTYIERMVSYVLQTTTLTPEEATTFVKAQVASKLHRPKLNIVKFPSPGNAEEAAGDALSFIDNTRNRIITPNGCVYLGTEAKQSQITRMIQDGLKERKGYKSQQIQAEGANDYDTAKGYEYLQTSVKINLNSLPGGFGSPYNIFYSKPNYNAITSTARTEIRRSFTLTEQLLGGNFAFYNEETVLDHINMLLPFVTQGVTFGMGALGRLAPVTADQLTEFYRSIICLYQPSCKLTAVRRVVNTLSVDQVNYLYYFCNLRHIIWNNHAQWLPVIHRLMDASALPPPDTTIDPEALRKVDSDLQAMLATIYSDDLKGMSFNDLPKKAPDLARRFLQIAKHVETIMVSEFKPIFDYLVDVDVAIPDPNQKPKMYRKMVIVSDTDSVIFTSKDWVKWFTGADIRISKEAFQIVALVVYWLTKSNGKMLERFARNQGVSPEFQSAVQMKNEFMFPMMLLYRVKKHYAGVIKIKEGTVLQNLKEEVKGGQLRGSTVSGDMNKWCEQFIVKDVLTQAMTGSISAKALIDKVIAKEQEIHASIQRSECTYLRMASVRTKEEYKKPMSSTYFNYLAWEYIFSETYGSFVAPTKAPTVDVMKPTQGYLDWLKEANPVIYRKLMEFVEFYKKWPSEIIINPMTRTIPKELIPVINTRKIIVRNLTGAYLTLQSLNIATGFPTAKHPVILCDIY